MNEQNDLDMHRRIPPKISRKSYFALIPVFNRKRRQNHDTERNIIKIIRNSDIGKSNPVLKTLLIENVRICCIVIETSGKQSGKILCASAPYILALISKANPKLEHLLKSETLSSCLSILQSCDLDSLLSQVYQTTMVIHKGVKKFYPVLCVSLVKDSFLFSEKSLVYMLNLVLYVLQSCTELFYENFRPFIYYLCRENYALASSIFDLIPQLVVRSLKFCVTASAYSQKTVILIFQFVRNVIPYLSGIVNRICKDSSLNSMMKNMCSYLNVCVRYLRSTVACSHIEQYLSHFVSISKPYVLKYFQKLFAVMKALILAYMPLLKDSIMHVFKDWLPLLRNFVYDNLPDILKAYNYLKTFLSENRHRLSSLCCFACRYIYSFVIYLFRALQAALPHIIQFSSNGIISIIICLNFMLDHCMLFFKFVCEYTAFIFGSCQELMCHLSHNSFNILKNIYKVFVKIQPYMVLIFRIFISELTKLTHALAPTLLACLQEINSSLCYASKEVVSKSCLAVKRILPSFYHTVKAVVPPTVQAAHEIIKSSTKSVVVIYPALFRSILTIRPELEEGIIVLFTDGNKACLEVISVSFSASCELKDAAVTVSSNLPVLFRAFREVLITTSHAAVEVSATSFNAKARMLKDIKRAHDTVHASFLLAEQEIFEVYVGAMFEINTVLSSSSKNYLLYNSNPFIRKSVINFISNLFENFLRIVDGIPKFTINLSSNITQNLALCFRNFMKVVAYVYTSVFFIVYLLYTKFLRHKVFKDLCTSLLSSFRQIWGTAMNGIASQIMHQCDDICNNLVDVNIKVMHNLCVYLSKAWDVSKDYIHMFWNAVCLLAPEMWTRLEYLISVVWDFCLEHIPVLWIAWKGFCCSMWKVINDLAPHVWQYFSSVVPVMWSSMRVLVKHFWSYSIDSSSFMWRQSTLLTSEYWLLSNTYLPYIWSTSCAETRKGWDITCCLIENCWTFTVETCLLSWKFLHDSVSKSWRGSIAVTKTAYCVLTASGLVLKKSFCICCKSKKCVCLVIKATPRFSKLRSMLQLSAITKEFNRSESDAAYNPSSKHLRFSTSINNYICAVINILPSFDKLCSFEVFTPSKMFRNHSAKLAVC